jgi:hypothetical protein
MIYTIGNIAVSGNTLTGTGTNFKAPLSMIRVGCTVIVKSDPIQIFSITEIVSETELSVTPAASPDIPAGTAYSILLCDSISVDGLAQDVAEALRYFTGQESEIYAAVEYWKNYGDDAQVEALLTAIQAETAQSTANAAATAADVETTAAALNETVAAKDAAEAAAANVAADEQKIAANAAAAAEAATSAALSEANAKTYAEQAKALSEDSFSFIGLGANRRDWPDCTTDPSDYIGFVRLEEATATGFPSIASGEVYLVGWLARGDGLIINGCFVGTNTRSLYTYMYNNADGTYGWTRHARKDEVDRLIQGSTETVLWGAGGKQKFVLWDAGTGATMNWGVYDDSNAKWVPLNIVAGGTGATTAEGARTNLGLGATNDVQHQNLTLASTRDGTDGLVAGGMHKSVLLGTDGTVRAEGLMYAECNASSPTQLTFAIHSATEGYKYLSFNTKGQILAETAIFRSTYVNPLVIESVNPTVMFNETARPSGAPYYSFIADGGNWRIQKEGDGYSGEYIISYEYANDHIVIPNLKVEDLYAPDDKVQQIKNNLLIPNTGLSRWYEYAAPEGAEADKFYPIIISHPSGWNGEAFVEVSMRTHSMQGAEEPNCNAIHLWMRDGGWSDMGQGCFGHYCAYASSEAAILCVRGTDKGQYPHNTIYVRGDAFPIRLAATVGSTITIPTADWSPSTASDSPTYKWGITSSIDGLDHDTYGMSVNLLDFTSGQSGFYSDKAFRNGVGTEYIANYTTYDRFDLTLNNGMNITGKQTVTGSISSGGSIYAVSSDVTGNTFVSKLTDTSSNVIGQSEFRAAENQGQIVVRDLTSTASHKFFNFNKDGTFSSPSGLVTHTGSNLNSQQSDNVNKFKPIAGQIGSPENNVVYGGFHVGFSGNYATQFVGRKSKFFARTFEAGTDNGWCQLAILNAYNKWTDLQHFTRTRHCDPDFRRGIGINSVGTASKDAEISLWGESSRPSVFEFKLKEPNTDTPLKWIFYGQLNTDNSVHLQVNGAINCVAVNQSSDRDLKDNIQIIGDATEAIRKMNGYTYTLKENGLPYAGVIAQEVMEALPEAVGSFTHYGEALQGPTIDGNELREETRYLNVDYAAVTGLLVQVARETDNRVTELEKENASLRANIAVMDERITKLETLVQQLTGSEE